LPFIASFTETETITSDKRRSQSMEPRRRFTE
jgi:hypothetical protein